jgi:hypothetical protein
MNKQDKDTQLKLKCLDIATSIEIELEADIEIPRIFVRANDIYNQACKWGYMDIVSPYKKPAADLNLKLKRALGEKTEKPTEDQKEVVKIEKEKIYQREQNKPEQPKQEEKSPVMEPTKGAIPAGMKACPNCKQWIPEKWEKHAYKTNGERCGWNI